MEINETSVVCPTVITTESKDVAGRVKCVYTTTAYVLLALVLAVVVILALVVVYCCFLRWRGKRRYREYSRPVSHDNNSIEEFPYQPLARNPEGYSNYGTVDSGIDDVRSPSQSHNGSIAERLSQQQDTNSVASSRASLNPNYDEASLNQRTTLISKRPRAPTPEIRTQRGHKKTDTEQIGSPTSNGSHRQPSQSYSDGLYAAVDVVGTNPRTLQPDTSCPGQYAGRSVPDEMPEADGPVYAVLEEAELQEARADQSNNKDGDGLQVQTDFDYVDQQPPLPHPAGDEDDRLLLAAVVGGTKEAHDTPGNENMTEDAEYLTIVPPSQLPTNAEEDELEISTEPANVGQARRKRLKSRADHEEFLLNHLQNAPDSERNGTYLVRESVSSPGSKVLTLFYRTPDSDKEIYNFKIYSSEDGQLYLFKGKTNFQDTESLLEYYKTNQDMLPCVLTGQVYTDQGHTVV